MSLKRHYVLETAQVTIICSRSTIEIPEKDVKYVQS